MPTLADGKTFYELQLQDNEITINTIVFSASTSEFKITFDGNTSNTKTFAYSQKDNNLTIMDPNTNETLDMLNFYQPASSSSTYFALATQNSGPTLNYYFTSLDAAKLYVKNASL